MVPLFFRFNHFRGNTISEFFHKYQVAKKLMQISDQNVLAGREQGLPQPYLILH
jgi:hypothetical protein